jgi:hypothetical protein
MLFEPGQARWMLALEILAPDSDVYAHTLPAHPAEEAVCVGEAATVCRCTPPRSSRVKLPTKISAGRLQGVPETLLLPLYNRALESKRTDAIVHDERAVELLGRIDYDFSKFGKLHVGFLVRAERTDDSVREFLARYPDGAVMNLGGDSIPSFIVSTTGGRVHWFEIDLPESIGVRGELRFKRHP